MEPRAGLHDARPHVAAGLEYLRSAGVTPDERIAEAIDLVASKRDADGGWPLETWYPGVMPVEIDEGEDRPSRWNTLRAWQTRSAPTRALLHASSGTDGRYPSFCPESSRSSSHARQIRGVGAASARFSD